MTAIDMCLTDQAKSTLAAIARLDKLLGDTSDFGEGTGFCMEFVELVVDTHTQLEELQQRAGAIGQRFAQRAGTSDHMP